MRQFVLRFGAATLVALGISFADSISANAESIMKECGAEWQAAKGAGTTNGQDVAAVPEIVPHPAPRRGSGPGGRAISTSGSGADSSCGCGRQDRQGVQRRIRAEQGGNQSCRAEEGRLRRSVSRRQRDHPARGGRRPRPSTSFGAGPRARPNERACSGADGSRSDGDSDRRRPVCNRSAGEDPLPDRHGGVGQHRLWRLPFCWHTQLRPHKAGRVHVRGRREGSRRPRREEREAPVRMNDQRRPPRPNGCGGGSFSPSSANAARTAAGYHFLPLPGGTIRRRVSSTAIP